MLLSFSYSNLVDLFCPLCFLLAVFTVYFMGVARLSVHMLFTEACDTLVPVIYWVTGYVYKQIESIATKFLKSNLAFWIFHIFLTVNFAILVSSNLTPILRSRRGSVADRYCVFVLSKFEFHMITYNAKTSDRISRLVLWLCVHVDSLRLFN